MPNQIHNHLSKSDPAFVVIMSTYNRPKEVLRSVESVRKQSYKHWELYVVIDDVKSDYSQLQHQCNDDEKIHIIQNLNNIGKNKSLNCVLDILSERKFLGYVVYLDDDDWLNEDCLLDFAKTIRELHNPNWIVSKRTNSETNASFTIAPALSDNFNYNTDVLLMRKFYGDATHCINFSFTSQCRFSTHIKNAEEWIYFSQVARDTNFYYLDKTGTFSNGYNLQGLTNMHRNNFKNYLAVLTDVWHFRLFSLSIILYLFGRLIKIIMRNLFRNSYKVRS